MAIELIPLCDVSIELREPLVLPSTPSGTRIIVEVESGSVVGERLTGSMHGAAAADWMTLSKDGTGTLDVRMTLQTGDGALIFVQYLGRTDMRGFPDPAPIYVAPRFETGDERYTWLNRIQAVGKGTLDGSHLTYEWHEVR